MLRSSVVVEGRRRAQASSSSSVFQLAVQWFSRQLTEEESVGDRHDEEDKSRKTQEKGVEIIIII